MRDILAVTAVKRPEPIFPKISRRLPRIVVPNRAESFPDLTICASCSSNEQLERPESACMLSSVQSTFRESSRIAPRVLMVTGGQGRHLPSEFQGLKGWRRRWIHSTTTYI